MTIAVDLGRKATKQTNKQKQKNFEIFKFFSKKIDIFSELIQSTC